MKQLFFAFALGLAGAGALRAESALDLSKFDVTFDEEFDSLSVSPWGPGTRWIAHTPWNGDFGDAKFVNPRADFPFTTKDGLLRIEARRNESGKWESGLLASVDRAGNGFSQKYGYFEVRAKFPAGKGLWPAFWLIGIDRSTHTSEIDVVEHYGHTPERYTASVHVWDRKEPKKSSTVHKRVPVKPGSLYEDFHTYGVLIDEQWTRFYLDRREVWKNPTPEQHRQPMYVLVNLGLGAGWPLDEAPESAEMLVDYVRVWRAKPE